MEFSLILGTALPFKIVGRKSDYFYIFSIKSQDINPFIRIALQGYEQEKLKCYSSPHCNDRDIAVGDESQDQIAQTQA